MVMVTAPVWFTLGQGKQALNKKRKCDEVYKEKCEAL